MYLLNAVKRKWRRLAGQEVAWEAAKAYDLWAASYDAQPDNLLIHLDEQLFEELSADIPFTGKVVADVGCGTGRYWEALLDRQPARLVGFDVSPEMLAVLRRKFPSAETQLLVDQSLPGWQAGSCDIVLCNLALGYIEDLEAAFAEWDRVLKRGGVVLISDLHPEALVRGGDRSFVHEHEKVLIRSHVHPLQKIETLAAALGWRSAACAEKKVDESIRPFYEARNALRQYELICESSPGALVSYGWRFEKV